MYDLNLTIPNITADKYSSDNKFKLLKNYLYELNETLSFVLGQNYSEAVALTGKLQESLSKSEMSTTIQLKADAIKKFNELKNQIIQTADSIETNYKSEISKTEDAIMSHIEQSTLSKSEFGEYKGEVETNLRQAVDEIELVAENVDDVSSGLENFKSAARSELSVTADAVMSRVENLFQTKNDADEFEKRVSSTITQTQSNITENYKKELSQLSEDVSTVGGNVADLISSLDVYIRRGELSEGVYGIEIGRSDSNVKARFTNDRLSFYQGASEVAYISGSSLYITNAEVSDYLRIGSTSLGHFLFDTTENGLEVRWIE